MVLEALAEAVEEVVIHSDERVLAGALAVRDRLDAKISAAVGEFDAAELWDVDGSVSVTAWLRIHGGRTHREATRLSVTARKLRSLPGLRAAWEAGRADALNAIVRHYLDHQKTKTGGRHRPHLNVIVTLADLVNGLPGRTLEGLVLDPATIQRLACDAGTHRVITDGKSSILDYGRTTRTIPPAVYTSLVVRDWGCRFPGCDRPADWTEGHHIVPWEHGGPTCLSNLVLCSAPSTTTAST